MCSVDVLHRDLLGTTLPHRSPASTAARFADYREVEIISRDRAGVYAEEAVLAASSICPQNSGPCIVTGHHHCGVLGSASKPPA